MKILVAIAFILIIASLASALFYLVKDKEQGKHVVKALTLRIGFSVALFVFILIAYRLGYIQPNGG